MEPCDYKLEAEIKLDKTLGYEYFIDRAHPLANSQGKVYYHRHVASVKIGRWLFSWEDVHHENKNKSCNEASNLEVMTRAEHGALHAPLPKIIDCEECGTSTRNKKYCSYHCSAQGTRKVSRPDKLQLAQDISELSWLAIGRKYGVSDNAVRKWARKYDLI